MLVSIIIPVYNVEKFFPKCIESVLGQTYSNIEIILIDDGSTDNSGNICDELEKEYEKIKVVHKINGGLSSARNVGIEMAEGEALFFLDSDDYISKNCIEQCVNMLYKSDSDIAIMQMLYIGEKTNEEIKNNTIIKEYILTAEQAIEESLYQRKYSCCATAKLFKKDVIENIRFPVYKLSEDLAVCHLILNNANKVIYTDEIGYYYRQRNNSIMHLFNPKRFDALDWAHDIEKFCEQKYPSIIEAAICRTFNVAIHLLLDLPRSGEIHKFYSKILWTDIKRTRKKVIHNPKARKRERVVAFLSYFGENILFISWNSGLAIKRKNK